MPNEPDEDQSESDFLIAYDYGMGGLWGILIAPSAAAILAKYPELALLTSHRLGWTAHTWPNYVQRRYGWTMTRRKVF